MFELFCRRVDISVAGGDETRTSALEKHEERAIYQEEKKNSIEEAFWLESDIQKPTNRRFVSWKVNYFKISIQYFV